MPTDRAAYAVKKNTDGIINGLCDFFIRRGLLESVKNTFPNAAFNELHEQLGVDGNIIGPQQPFIRPATQGFCDTLLGGSFNVAASNAPNVGILVNRVYCRPVAGNFRYYRLKNFAPNLIQGDFGRRRGIHGAGCNDARANLGNMRREKAILAPEIFDQRGIGTSSTAHNIPHGRLFGPLVRKNVPRRL